MVVTKQEAFDNGAVRHGEKDNYEEVACRLQRVERSEPTCCLCTHFAKTSSNHNKSPAIPSTATSKFNLASSSFLIVSRTRRRKFFFSSHLTYLLLILLLIATATGSTTLQKPRSQHRNISNYNSTKKNLHNSFLKKENNLLVHRATRPSSKPPSSISNFLAVHVVYKVGNDDNGYHGDERADFELVFSNYRRRSRFAIKFWRDKVKIGYFRRDKEIAIGNYDDQQRRTPPHEGKVVTRNIHFVFRNGHVMLRDGCKARSRIAGLPRFHLTRFIGKSSVFHTARGPPYYHRSKLKICSVDVYTQKMKNEIGRRNQLSSVNCRKHQTSLMMKCNAGNTWSGKSRFNELGWRRRRRINKRLTRKSYKSTGSKRYRTSGLINKKVEEEEETGNKEDDQVIASSRSGDRDKQENMTTSLQDAAATELIVDNVTSYWKRDASYQMGRVSAADAAAFVAKPLIVSKYDRGVDGGATNISTYDEKIAAQTSPVLPTNNYNQIATTLPPIDDLATSAAFNFSHVTPTPAPESTVETTIVANVPEQKYTKEIEISDLNETCPRQLIDRVYWSDTSTSMYVCLDMCSEMQCLLVGAKGSSGPKGRRGPPGERGSPGSIGAQGPPGKKGNPGLPGLPGSKGPQGYPGLPGAFYGNKGHRGAQGPPGVPGRKGQKGIQGSRGFPGSIGRYGFVVREKLT